MPFTSRRASRTVHSRGPSSARSRARRTSALTKFQSNRALWATKIRPARTSTTRSQTSAKVGAARTISSVMLVMARIAGGIGRPGFTRDSNTTSRRPPQTTTTAISVIRSLPTRAHARRLHVHHREGALLQQRRALRLGHQAPATVREPADARVGIPAARPRSGRRSRRGASLRPRTSRQSMVDALRARPERRRGTRSTSVLLGCAESPITGPPAGAAATCSAARRRPAPAPSPRP